MENNAGPDKGMRVIGARRRMRGGLLAAAGFLELVVRLRGNQPFIPKGVHRFRSFQESDEWSIKMMARKKSPVPRP